MFPLSIRIKPLVETAHLPKEAILYRGVNAVLRRIVIFGEQIVKYLFKNGAITYSNWNYLGYNLLLVLTPLSFLVSLCLAEQLLLLDFSNETDALVAEKAILEPNFIGLAENEFWTFLQNNYRFGIRRPSSLCGNGRPAKIKKSRHPTI